MWRIHTIHMSDVSACVYAIVTEIMNRLIHTYKSDVSACVYAIVTEIMNLLIHTYE